MEDKDIKILEEINNTLKEINARQEADKMFSESDELLKKVDTRVEHSTNRAYPEFCVWVIRIQLFYDSLFYSIFKINV